MFDDLNTIFEFNSEKGIQKFKRIVLALKENKIQIRNNEHKELKGYIQNNLQKISSFIYHTLESANKTKNDKSLSYTYLCSNLPDLINKAAASTIIDDQIKFTLLCDIISRYIENEKNNIYIIQYSLLTMKTLSTSLIKDLFKKIISQYISIDRYREIINSFFVEIFKQNPNLRNKYCLWYLYTLYQQESALKNFRWSDFDGVLDINKILLNFRPNIVNDQLFNFITEVLNHFFIEKSKQSCYNLLKELSRLLCNTIEDIDSYETLLFLYFSIALNLFMEIKCDDYDSLQCIYLVKEIVSTKNMNKIKVNEEDNFQDKSDKEINLGNSIVLNANIYENLWEFIVNMQERENQDTEGNKINRVEHIINNLYSNLINLTKVNTKTIKTNLSEDNKDLHDYNLNFNLKDLLYAAESDDIKRTENLSDRFIKYLKNQDTVIGTIIS